MSEVNTNRENGCNCDFSGQSHEHGPGQACGPDCGCGDSAAGCAGCAGCGTPTPQYLFEGKNVGKVVKVHYEGTLDNGERFDSSYDRDPLEFTCGIGSMIRGFDRAVADMEPGDVVNVHLEPEEAYGRHEEYLIISMGKNELPGMDELVVGDEVMLQDEMGRPYEAIVCAADETTVSFDLNHPMAGKALNFKIEMLEVR